MKLLVLDNIGSFSLLDQFKKKFAGQVFSMNNLASDKMWEIFLSVRPDIVFVDFCNENAVDLTKRLSAANKPYRPKVVIRLHGYEAQSWYMTSINWSVVSHLAVVSPKFKEIVDSKLPAGGNGSVVVPNGIDLSRFQLQSADEMDASAVAYAGYLNKKKGPTLLRTIFLSLPGTTFHVAGAFQDEHVRLYMEDLPLGNVRYHGWVNTAEFFKGKRFVLSTSVTESFGMSIGEGMAMGLTPLVHWWPGADKIWPVECLWTTFQQISEIPPLPPSFCRKWIEDRYSLDRCVDSFLGLFEK